MKLRKRFLSVVLAVAMVVSSLQVPEMTLWAKELSGETAAIDDLSVEEVETQDIRDSEQPEGDLEKSDSDDSEEHTAETDEGGTDGTEMTGNGTETAEEEITETDTVALETTEEVQTVEGEEEPDLPIRIVEEELDGVYQFGGAPTENASSEEDAVDVHTLAAENEISVEEYIYQEALKKSSEINILSYNIPKDNLANIVSGVLNEHPDLYFVENGYSYSSSGTTVYSVFLTYNTSLDDNAFREEVDTALSTVKSGMSDLQKAIVLHDYLTVNCEYDLDRLNSNTMPKVSYSAYGVLVNRMAVCQGYALAYKYLLKQVGINCYMVTSDKMNHAWNLIELDGQYYQVDVTWDDPTRDLIGRSVHKYMFRSDEQLEGHNNWVVTSGSDVVDYKATDTRYDTAFWADVRSPLIFAGNNWQDCYYVAYGNHSINRTTLSDNAANAGSSICSIDKWTVWNDDNSYWQGAYSGLFQYNNRLYYNDKLSIYSIAFDGSDKQTEFTPDTAEGYIYGSALCQGKVLYSLHQDPNLSAKETVLEADISIQEPEKKHYIEAHKEETEYQCGDTIDLSDLTVTYYDEKGEGQEVTGYTTNADEIDMETAGTKELVITYNGITTTITLTVMETYIAQGSYEDITWSIDGSGKLVVTGSGDFSGDTGQSRAPWYQWRAQIKSAEISVTGMTDASYMFFDCSNLAAIDFSDFNTAAVTNMRAMFCQCSSLTDLNLSGFNTSNVTDMSDIFEYCSGLTGLDLSDFDTSNVTDMGYMFYECKNLAELNISGFDTSNVTDMSAMFYGCESLVSLDLSSFSTSNVRTMGSKTGGMFSYCSSLAHLDLSSFDTSNVDDELWGMSYMFEGCSSLESLDLTGFNTGKVKRMDYMFAGCSSLTSLDLSSFNTSNVNGEYGSMQGMFMGCSSLASLDLNHFDTSKVVNMREMFEGCQNLQSLLIDNFDTGRVTDMTDMFSGCRDLSNLNLSSFDVSNVTNMDRIFDNCNSLNYLHTPQNVSVSTALPSGTWYDSSGKTYAELPKLTYSILLAKNEIPTTSQEYITATKSKTEYKIGEIIDLSDLTVIYHEMGKKQKVTGYTTNVDQIDMTTVGMKELVITYKGLTVTIELIVSMSEEPGQDEKESYITAAKVKTEYKIGETIDLSDLTVTYFDKDGTGRILESTDYQTNADGIDLTTVGTKDLVITYHSYTTTIRLTVVENKDGLKVVLADPDEVYVYTGAAIIPKIVVTNNGRSLREGIDYSVKYTNNVKASRTAKITVTGKGNLTGSKTMEFTISPKMLDNGDNIVMRVEGSSVTVLEGAKASPILLYGGAKLTAKDFQFKDSADKNYKWKAGDSGRTISVTGKGNFTGERVLSVNVISKEQQGQRKLIVSLSNDIKTLTYDGEPIDMTGYVDIYTAETPVGNLVENKDYMISWPQDMTSSGTRKFTVVGISDRCIGTVIKSYTIKPKKTAFDVTFNKAAGYPYVNTGSTIDDLIVKDGVRRLTEGVDYKVSYSNNKKVGNAAKFKVTGLGNYKGSTYNNGRYENFTIRPGSLKDASIVVGDMVFNKEGVYKSVPYVSIHGIAVKSSEYNVTYYLEDPSTTADPQIMDRNNKITAGGTRVWVKITGKNNRNYAAADADNYAVESYMICSKDSGFDLSKAKVSFYKDGTKINKVSYTGNPITESDIEVRVTYKVNGINEILDSDDYTVKFTNNVNKGKATVVVIGNGDQYIGSKTATFSIGATNLRDVLGLFG